MTGAWLAEWHKGKQAPSVAKVCNGLTDETKLPCPLLQSLWARQAIFWDSTYAKSLSACLFAQRTVCLTATQPWACWTLQSPHALPGEGTGFPSCCTGQPSTCSALAHWPSCGRPDGQAIHSPCGAGVARKGARTNLPPSSSMELLLVGFRPPLPPRGLLGAG